MQEGVQMALKEEVDMISNKLTTSIKERSRLTKEEWREYTKTVWQIPNIVHPDHPAAFPEEIPSRLTKLFSFVGETVLDPFAGSGMTAVAAINLLRNAVCVDCNPEYTEVCRRSVDAIETDEAQLTAHTGDSRNLGWIEDDSIALAVTSPPYWNKADYGSRQENLGNEPNYLKFIESLKPVFQECFRVLMPGRKICIVTANVNLYTDQGLLSFPIAADIAMLLRGMGFLMINEIIWNKDGTGGKWGSSGKQRPIFGSYPYPPNFLFKNVHEYILVFAKPVDGRKTGPKALPYGDVMGASIVLPEAQIDDLDLRSTELAENGHKLIGETEHYHNGQTG